MFMEMIKTMSISSKEMNKRFVNKYRVDKEYEQKEKDHAFSLPLCKLGVVNHS
jgi:hypothetical protein